MEELKNRKTPRHPYFNYNHAGIYFITICTQNRRCILSRIVGTGVLDCPRVELTNYGEIADKYIRQLNDFYHHLSIEKYVIMPNHIHLLLWIKEENINESGQSRTPVPTNVSRSNCAFSRFISAFKRFCNKEYGGNIWQGRCYDHIIRSKDDLNQHIKYIHENPMYWHLDEFFSKE